MIDCLFNTQTLPLALLGLFVFSVLLHEAFYWLGFFRLARKGAAGLPETCPGVSVVICAHNEYHHLKETLPAILEQDHPDFEVLVVNHSSDDDTAFLLQRLEEQYPCLKTINISQDLNFFTGKKFPLSIGIKSARHDMVLLTDADCKPSSRMWIRHMQSAYRPDTEVVLGYGPYSRAAGLLNKLIRFDTAHIAIQYLSYALAGIAYMGVGRNLSYLKRLFYSNQGFISHYRISSGDDDLFINRVAKRSNTAIMVHPDSYTFSDPKNSAGSWITQKRRHFSTNHLYRFHHRLLLGAYAASLFTFYTLLILLPALNWSVIPVLALFVLRMITQYIVFAGCFRRLNERDLIPLIPLYEILLLLVNAGVFISNVIRKPSRWK
jgi:glycosyltransferase involved in cell wall biosynthesis